MTECTTRLPRLFCHHFEADRFRLVLHAAAYVLMHTLLTLLGGTELPGQQSATLPLSWREE